MLKSGSALGIVPGLARKAWNLARWEIVSRLREAQDRRTVRALRSADATGPEAIEQAAGPVAIPFLKLYEVAHKEHRPVGILQATSVALFKASHDTGLADDMPYRMVYRDYALGWGKRVREDIVILDVPGGHSSSLQDPHVETLAPLFQAALDEALADHGAWGASPAGSEEHFGIFEEAAE